MANAKEKATTPAAELTNKFITKLSSSPEAVIASRAKILAQQAASKATGLVTKLDEERLDLELKILTLTDLAPETSFSMVPGGVNFDATKWIADLHKTTLALKMKNIELEAAQEIVDEWFGNNA
jgi:hypothetical protein